VIGLLFDNPRAGRRGGDVAITLVPVSPRPSGPLLGHPLQPYVSGRKFVDPSGHELWSINVVAADEDKIRRDSSDLARAALRGGSPLCPACPRRPAAQADADPVRRYILSVVDMRVEGTAVERVDPLVLDHAGRTTCRRARTAPSCIDLRAAPARRGLGLDLQLCLT